MSIRNSFWVLMLALLSSPAPISADASRTFSAFPPREKVISFLLQTADWYRHLSIDQQVGGDQADFLFIQENRAMGAQIVRLSSDFAKLYVSIEATLPRGPNSTEISVEDRHELQNISGMEARAKAQAQAARNELTSLAQKRLTTRGKGRNKIALEIKEAQSELAILDARATSFHNLLEFMRSTDGIHSGADDLELLIRSLDTIAPDGADTSGTSVAVASRSADPAGHVRQRSAGMLAQISDVLTLAHGLRAITEIENLTTSLARTSQAIRTPLVAPIDQALYTSDWLQGDQPKTIDALKEQTSRLETLTDEATKISPAVAALDKQRILLEQVQSHVTAFQSSLTSRYRTALENLVERIVILVIAIALLTGAAATLRRFIAHHIQDPNQRNMLFLVQRLLFWTALATALFFAFAFEVSSMATFLGLLSAGVAVALQNVIIAAAGYLLLVGKFGLRVGDRIQISGVTGDVAEIGLMQFQLNEFDAQGRQPTGRVVSFSNSFVFVSPATGLFKVVRDRVQASK